MVVLLNSDDLAPADRPSALEAIFAANEVPQRVRYVSAPRTVKHRLEMFQYGPDVHMMRNTGTGLLIDRGHRHVAAGAPEQLAVFYQQRGLGNLSREDSRHVYRAGQVGVIDTIQPYSWQSKRMDHFVMLIDNPGLGLSTEQLLLAGDQLTSSPLYDVAKAYFARLCAGADDLHADAMAALGRATAQLLRATVISAAGGTSAAASIEQTLFIRMTSYVDAHLHDSELSTAEIASAHFISVRHLYNVWVRETGQSPAGWIMNRRLERAADLMARNGRAALHISRIASQCGFADLSHFSRRFRAAYGLTPTEWSLNHSEE
jgi:AraC family transcriptional activator of tynA and feaB